MGEADARSRGFRDFNLRLRADVDVAEFWRGRLPEPTPFHRLALALIEQALADVLAAHRHPYAADAYAFIFDASRDRDAWCFAMLCDALGIHVEAIRRTVAQRLQQQTHWPRRYRQAVSPQKAPPTPRYAGAYVCRRCGRTRPAADFDATAQQRLAHGYYGVCRQCRSQVREKSRRKLALLSLTQRSGRPRH